MTKTVCIIGAGASGLVATKSCLECGLRPTCYEKTDNIGGVWRFRPETIDGVGSVMRSTTLVTSKEFTTFSDFPPDKRSANYMHHSKFLKYLEDYATHFNLYPHILISHEVVMVQRHSEYETTGQWVVHVKRMDTSVMTEIYDAVMFCSGNFVNPNIPFFPGLELFKGKVFHSHVYKDHQGLETKRIAVVGVGTSGTNIATELAKVTHHVPVHLCARTGAWIIQRVEENGMPWDIYYARRYLHFLYGKILPLSVTNEIFEAKLNHRMDHALFRLRPPHRFVDKNATVEDDLAIRILTGTVAIRGGIERLTENGIVFKGDEEPTPIDVVIMATGYNLKLPSIEEDVMQLQNDRMDLYRFIFPPHLNHPSLAVIGILQPNGAILPIVEMQSRYVAEVFAGNISLPSQKEMHNEVEAHNRVKCANPYETDWLTYLDTLAEDIGVKPSFYSMAMSDPLLCFKCIFGPCLPYQYRLQGPNQWREARSTILSVYDRIKAPFDTKQEMVQARSFPLLGFALAGLIFVFFISYFFF